ncbi:bifunctional glycosyltransferase family 2/GtrA family protein [Mobilicoccus massiliensis]|uniref:bifunctional glycosyltransferase family 2/GtrA family protein n=1 Tax=Mobilicoccus massiliensis TaxID=1522310 RepID=UPI000590807A|nr:bifunctional glycosyltransferase family 2/GtrA family protein [Mobilicoccus massiliensis]
MNTAIRPVIDVVVPVHDEEATLDACVRRLHDHLSTYIPYPFRITIADNASTDLTPAVAADLAARFPDVRYLRLEQKGRGRALKRAWLGSDADVLAYMDVDLSTDLDAFFPLVAPLLSGHSDLAIGSRLARGSRVVRGPKREFVSRSYNLLLRGGMGATFTDAQCGFKAIRADVATELLPLVEDDAWFFDTEMLVLAQRSGLRIHEVPVDWLDDPDSRVDVVATARADLAGMARVRRALGRGQVPVGAVARHLGRGGLGSNPVGRIGRFAGVGVLSTLVHLGLFALLGLVGVGAQLANVLGLLAGTMVNTAANRRWTFGVRGREQAVAHQMQGLAILGLTWLTSAGALWVTAVLVPGAPTLVQTVAVGAANVVATIVKYGVFRHTMTPADGFFATADDDSLCPVWTLASSTATPARRPDVITRS